MTALVQYLRRVEKPVQTGEILDTIIHGDVFDIAPFLPSAFVDLLILDPPYNIEKNYGGSIFKKKSAAEYRRWFQKMIDALCPLLKDRATIYVCSDWKTSMLILPVLEEYFSHPESHHLGKRKRARGENKLEKQFGGYLVLHKVARL